MIGEFNGWNRTANPMHKVSDTVWEAELPRLKQFDSYKYSIETQDGRILDKADLMPHTMSAGRHRLQAV